MSSSGKKSSSSSSSKRTLGPIIDPDEIELQELIGEGCFGRVYRGKCRAQDVAIKVPKKQDIKKKKLEAFLREVEIMSNTYCPYITLYMGACTVPGKIMIVTELLDTDVEHILADKKKQLTLYQRMKMAKDASHGMAWLHGANPRIIHRDLKTSNLLLDKTLRVKVCDFGLSQLCKTGQKYVDEDGAKGTPLYMAPEVLAGEEFNEKADVYSFAIVMWEMVTREEAFGHHSDYDEFVEAVCDKFERPPLSQKIHPSIRKLLEQLWDDDPNTRPTFPEIVQSLENIIVDVSIPCERTASMWKRHFKDVEEVEWPTFIKAFAADVLHLKSDLQVLMDSLEVRCFKALCIPNITSDKVHMERLGKVMGWFGPANDHFLVHVRDILRQNWFFGDTNARTAQNKLSKEKPGTFLVRFSSNNTTPSWFTISRVTSDRQIVHLRVMHEAGGDFVLDNKTYPDLAKLISAQYKLGKTKHACSDSPYQWIFEKATNAIVGDGYKLDDV
eukprot:TRINITY_DN7489_c0_g1_i1.p1 TRINITY_DN7489_c0_g1~~TRINITY_DN7489_c0_g1_i1.p1  ORF type:complete len:517 (+),score=149.34 TRINITY_DN7489_c0_g1_i1:57-1553(+)